MNSVCTATTRKVSIRGESGAPPTVGTSTPTGVGCESLVLDGRVEQFVQSRCVDLPISDMQQLKPFLEDTRGLVGKARNLLALGAETVAVDLRPETGHQWEARATSRGGVELTDPASFMEEKIILGQDPSYARLEVNPCITIDGKHCQQTIQAQMRGGQIVCLMESFETSETERQDVG